MDSRDGEFNVLTTEMQALRRQQKHNSLLREQARQIRAQSQRVREIRGNRRVLIDEFTNS